jgi:hypothetical protein
MTTRAYQVCPQCSFVGDFTLVHSYSCNACGAAGEGESPPEWITLQGQNGEQLGRLVHFCESCAKKIGLKRAS